MVTEVRQTAASIVAGRRGGPGRRGGTHGRAASFGDTRNSVPARLPEFLRAPLQWCLDDVETQCPLVAHSVAARIGPLPTNRICSIELLVITILPFRPSLNTIVASDCVQEKASDRPGGEATPPSSETRRGDGRLNAKRIVNCDRIVILNDQLTPSLLDGSVP